MAEENSVTSYHETSRGLDVLPVVIYGDGETIIFVAEKSLDDPFSRPLYHQGFHSHCVSSNYNIVLVPVHLITSFVNAPTHGVELTRIPVLGWGINRASLVTT